MNRYIFVGNKYWESRGVPCIDGYLPIIGNMWPLVTMRESFVTMYEKFYYRQPEQSMVGFYNFKKPCLLIRDPELIKIVMVSSFASFDNNISSLDQKLDPLLCRNPFFNHGDDWKNQRNVLNSGLSNKRLKVIVRQICDVSKKFEVYIDDNFKNNKNLVVEAQEFLSHFTAEVTATCGFGIDGKSFTKDPKSFQKMVKRMMEPSYTQVIAELIGFFYPRLKKLFQIRYLPWEIDQYFRDIIKNVIDARKQSPLPENDFLQQIIESTKNSENKNIDENYVVGHAASFFLNGQITSSFAISFVALQIALHPEVQKKIREEIEQIFLKHNGKMNYESLQEFKYMEQVINESIRLLPPLGFLGKTCTQKYSLTGNDGLYVEVEPETDIIIPVFGIHRDPKYWINPHVFDPDRFSEDNKHDRHKYVYLSFGAGPRACVGRRIAMLQMKASLVTLLRNCSLELHPRTKVPITVNPLSSLFTIVDGGIWIRINPLTN